METAEADGEDPVLPFRFRISTDRIWADGAVKLHTTEMKMTLPGGIDLLQSALTTLREEKEVERRNYEEKIEALDKKIGQLAALAFIPEGA